MNIPIKQLAKEAFTVAKPYDWYPSNWQLYAIVLAWEKQRYPNAPESLQARIDMRRN